MSDYKIVSLRDDDDHLEVTLADGSVVVTLTGDGIMSVYDDKDKYTINLNLLSEPDEMDCN